MAASDHLSKAQFPYTFLYKNTGEEPWTEHTVTAQHKGDSVGFMTWGHSGGVIDIGVAKAHQRKGVATGMWNHALSLGGTVDKASGITVPHAEHSAHRTRQGEAWAKSTGKSHYFPPEEIH